MPKSRPKFLQIITAPFRWTGWLFRKFYQGIKQLIARWRDFFSVEPEDSPLPDTLVKTVENPGSLVSHLVDLRKHLTRAILALLATSGVALYFYEALLDFLTRPVGGLEGVIAIDVTEPISTVMKITLLTGFATALPYIAFEVYLFIAPGIRVRARKWGLLAIPAVLILFIAGMAFAYYIMLPTAVPFLLQIGGVTAQIRLSSIVSFVTRVLFWIGLSFEFPLVIFILALFGLVNARFLAQNWRIAVVIIAVVAAMVTPTVDPFSMGLVMAPLIVLYFLSIGLAALAQRGRSESS